ncbi:hypothetical protein M758_2G242100 [Ceratodon purpureus]|nr:hypothetical protein M758_2G242100 [Ceratodon purpureus]
MLAGVLIVLFAISSNNWPASVTLRRALLTRFKSCCATSTQQYVCFVLRGWVY